MSCNLVKAYHAIMDLQVNVLLVSEYTDVYVSRMINCSWRASWSWPQQSLCAWTLQSLSPALPTGCYTTNRRWTRALWNGDLCSYSECDDVFLWLCVWVMGDWSYPLYIRKIYIICIYIISAHVDMHLGLCICGSICWIVVVCVALALQYLT